MAAKLCNKGCGFEIGFRQEHGRWIPVNADGSEHRDTCAMQKGLVRSGLKVTTRHHVSQYRIVRFRECQRKAYFADVLELPEGQKSPEMEAGSVVHACREFVAVERDKAGKLDEPVYSAEYLAALETVVGRESWSLEGLLLARDILESQKKPVDLSLAMRDEHGILCERAFELPCGEGVIAGGVLDLAEDVGDAVLLRDLKSGQWRDPHPEKSPQVALYLAWGRAVFAPRPVYFVLDYIALGIEEDPISWTPEIEESGKAMARALVTKARAQRENEEAWPATVGSGCTSCAFTYRCDAFKAAMEVGKPAREPETPVELAAAIHKYRPIANVSSGLVDRWTEKLKRIAGDLVKTESFTDEDGKVKTVGKAMLGPYPVRLTTYFQAPEKEIRKGGPRQRLDVGDPLETITLSPAAAAHLTEILANPPEPTPALVAILDEAVAPPTPTPKKRGRPRKTPLLAEAEASVALDKGPGETVVSECRHFVIGPCKLCDAAPAEVAGGK
jgi:hypothetical protein